METPGIFNYIKSRAQKQMICVAKNDLSLYIFYQLLLGNGFYTACCPYRHKDGGKDFTMISSDLTCPGPGFRICMLQLELKCSHDKVASYYLGLKFRMWNLEFEIWICILSTLVKCFYL